jgi:release factor glutamine methyltransferase
LSPLYPEEEAKAMAFRLLEHYCEIPSYKYISDPDLVLFDSASLRSDISSPSQKKCSVNEISPATLCTALDELSTGRPLQYVLGYTEFCGHRFKVGEGCLIPRPETEEVVSRIIDDLYEDTDDSLDDDPFNILDLCTGSGCIAWSLAAEFPEAMVYGCDLSDAALRYACRQRIKVGGAKPIFFTADVLAAPPAGLPKFDVIVSNPPYICDSERAAMRPNVVDFEPAEALFVPDDDPLKFYHAIARWADALLRPDGHLYLEINERFGPDVAALFPRSRLLPDIGGKDRFVIR